MPIRKEMLARYPENWKEISARIRFERARGRCEKCGATHFQPHPLTGSRVVLATAHLNHIPEDVRNENLQAMCQRCHLKYDRWFHRACKRTPDLFRSNYYTLSNKKPPEVNLGVRMSRQMLGKAETFSFILSR